MRRAGVALALAVLAGLGAYGLLARGGEGAPPDRAAAFVPAGARVYVNLSTGSPGFERLRNLSEDLAAIDAGAAGVLARLARLTRRSRIDPGRDIADWVKGEAAFAIVGGGRRPDWVAVIEARDPGAARTALRRVVGSEFAFTRNRVRAEGTERLVWAFHRGFALVGPKPGVRLALDVAAGTARPLSSLRSYRDLRRRLPPERLATAYLSNAGLRQRGGLPAAALARLAGAGELRAAAAALTLGEGRGRLTVAATPVGRGGCERPPVLPDLVDVAPPATAGLVEMATPGCALSDLAEGDGPAGRLLRRLDRRSRLSLERDLVPLLQRGAALLVTEPVSGPALVLLVEGAGSRGVEILSRLQPALLAEIAPVRRGQAPAFEAVTLADGTPALTAALGPGLELSYASIAGRLAVSTSLDGLDEVAREGGLGEEERVEAVLREAPDEATALVFLDLDQLLALAEQVGFADNAAYLALRDDLQKLRSAGAVVTRGEDHTTAELSFQIP
ncbi:MAG TPA: DUF3352 domain-containing protein [Thermoleophilaceae bacterium]|nr:DUF3352 domain-containing protein [Thermoleophilaceae bacterium]